MLEKAALANPDIAFTLVRDGRTIFAADADDLLDWEASAMSRYGRHQEEIRALLDDFERTGVAYYR